MKKVMLHVGLDSQEFLTFFLQEFLGINFFLGIPKNSKFMF